MITYVTTEVRTLYVVNYNTRLLIIAYIAGLLIMIHIYIHIRACTYSYIYAHTSKYTCMHMHTHVHLQSLQQF